MTRRGTRGNIRVAPVRRVEGTSSTSRQDFLSVEEPLEILLQGERVTVTMRTPGDDPDLALGFLLTEGVIGRPDQAVFAQDGSANSVHATLAPGVPFDPDRLRRNFMSTASCGICGKASIEDLLARVPGALAAGTLTCAPNVIHRLPARLLESQEAFARTGGLHAAGLFSADGALLARREDIGRHNAVDKLIGFAARTGIRTDNTILFLSGRVSFELIQKALMASIPLVAAVGAPSSLAVETARRFGLTLAGFVRDGRFNVYSGDWRIPGAASAA